MILIEAGTTDIRAFDAKIQFARQLANHGYKAVLDDSALPEEIHTTQRYDAIPYLAKIAERDITQALIIGSEEVTDDILVSLRAYQFEPKIPVAVVGRFATAQARIGARSKIAYALGYEPTIVNLTSIQPQPILATSIAPLFASRPSKRRANDGAVRLFLVVAKDTLEDPATLPYLSMLNQHPGLDCRIVTAGVGKSQIRTSRFSTMLAVGFSEMVPSTLAEVADIAVFFGPNLPGERMAAFALDLMQNGGVAIDCTDQGALVASGAPAVRGPADIRSLEPFLQGTILPNRAEIATQAINDPWFAANSFACLEKALALQPIKRRVPKPRKPRTLFLPTNGIGLGHAQRCSLVAAAMKKSSPVGFAAFPSCVPMLQARGFDCLPLVQKSEYHSEPGANDLVNYLRLGQVLRSTDRLVFDGGYVFEAIYRTIFELQLSAVWIRRGLLQPGQNSQTPLEREGVFERVIVPAEALDELNTNNTYAGQVHHVGPIVQRRDISTDCRKKIRAQLQKRFGHKFKKLVISMLGGGEAADRTAQMLSLCAQFNGRPDCLHLMVVWPNAKISASLTGWRNSHIVKSQHTVELCQASDLVVSAVGYNSFNEVLYHRVPAIFVPQMASYMDDQERRARAASERGLAVTVLSHELMTLGREVSAYLDDGKAAAIRENLSAVKLPKVGTAAAAALIEGIGDHVG